MLLPAFNEEEAIGPLVVEIRDAFRERDEVYEVLVVDDGSTDGTRAAAEAAGVRVLHRAENTGYGAAVKAGIEAARGDVVAMLDADGSYDPADLPALIDALAGREMVNGVRHRESGSWKALRVAAKWCVRKLAEWVASRRIPDPNTGMKVFRRECVLRQLWTLPDGFSCSTSMTLALLCSGRAVGNVEIDYRARSGQSKFRPVRDGLQYAATVVRLVMYFRPLRVFGPLAGFLALTAAVKGGIGLATSPTGIHDSDVILATASLVVLALGLLADLIVARSRNGG